MKVRWSIVLLVVFGFVAALAAALLTASMSARQIDAAGPAPVEMVTVLVAAKNLEAMEVVEADSVVEKEVEKEHAPNNYFADSSQIIGKVLSVPLINGQAFRNSSFPKDSSGLLMAANLPEGKRAVNVSLSDYSGLEGLLYPGSVVDVLAYFRINGANRSGDALSTTLLQSIQVLGVENMTVTSSPEAAEEKPRSAAGSRGLLVTLLVDSKQAEALQLAMEYGSISLAMRNPNDSSTFDSDATLLHSGQLARLGEFLGTTVEETPMPEEGSLQMATASTGSAAVGSTVDVSSEAADGSDNTIVASAGAVRNVPSQAASNLWQMEVIRGVSKRTDSFPLGNR